MPEVKSESILALVEIFGSFLYPMALTLQLPVYSFLIVLEKETRFRELSRIMGQKSATYWAATLVFNLSIYAVVVTCFWAAGAFLKLRFFVQMSSSLLFFFFRGPIAFFKDKIRGSYIQYIFIFRIYLYVTRLKTPLSCFRAFLCFLLILSYDQDLKCEMYHF